LFDLLVNECRDRFHEDGPFPEQLQLSHLTLAALSATCNLNNFLTPQSQVRSKSAILLPPIGAVSPRLEFAEGTVKFLPRLVFRRHFPRRSSASLCQLHGRTSCISRSVSQELLLALASLALFSLRSFGQYNSKKAAGSPMEAGLQLHLPHRDGVASMYSRAAALSAQSRYRTRCGI
jgi:hypothetical protein